MRARYACPLLFLPACLVAALVAAVLSGAGVGGLLWLFVYGDNPWPAYTDTVVMGLATCVGIGVLAAALVACHGFGRRLESAGGLRAGHVVFAIALTVLLPALVLLHQWRIGNLGGQPPDPSIRQFHAAPR